jgi:ATP synthase protein I
MDPEDRTCEARRQREEELGQQVGKKEQRKIKARGEQHKGVWFGLGMFGLVGWSVAVPTVVGVFAGVWIDNTWPSRFSWTLMCLFLGVVIGCWNAWYWVKREAEKR